jgi:arylformamidase
MEGMRTYDLTRTLQAHMPVYPGDPEVRFEPHADHAEAGYRVTSLRLGTHAGTHLDAPAHFLPEGAGVDALPLGSLVGPARWVEADRFGAVAPGERLLVRSGWSDRWGDPAYFQEFPPFPGGLAARAAAAPAALLGLETPSLHPDAVEDARLHRLLLGAGVVLVENLVLPAELPREFTLVVLPLPLYGLDGSPCRAVALQGDW